MFKAIGNLILILLICVGASGISVYYSPILDENMVRKNLVNSDSTITASSDAEESLLNPESIFIKYNSDKNIFFDFDEEYQFTVTVFKNEEQYKVHHLLKINSNTSTKIELTKGTPYGVSVDISQKELNLPNGEYKIEIMPNISNNQNSISPIIFNVKYLSNVQYIPATNIVPDNKIAFNLYFSDTNNSVGQLIGVTRFVDYTKRPLTTILEELKRGPSLELGLNMNPIIGSYNYVSLKGTTAYVDLPSSENLYIEGSEKSEAAMNSFIKSLTSYPGVDNVRFLVDYNRAKTFFNDVDITRSIVNSIENKVFLAYDSSNRYFLVECDVEDIAEDMAVEEKVTLIFNSLQNSKYYNLSSTIPSSVKLLSSRLENDTLVLNFNSYLLDAYNNNDNLNRMMLDSILFSFTSIKDVNKVKILVDGEIVENFANFYLSTEILRPLFLNPEF